MLLSSLPESWNGLVMALSNILSCVGTFKFDDVVSVILSKEVQRKSSRNSLVSGSGLTMEGK